LDKIFRIGFAVFAAALFVLLFWYRNTVIDGRPLSAEAAVIFRDRCAPCHGAAGEGRVDLAPSLRGRGLSPYHIKDAVSKGSGRMPAQPHIRGEALERLAQYVTALD
jgi:mono/diheme cytochrome c family protein